MAGLDAGTDFSGEPPGGGIDNAGVIETPLSDRLTAAQPLQVKPGGTGVSVGIGVGRSLGLPQQGGTVNRLRFEADRLDLTADGGWEATELRLTNDPFSPPELELRADRAVLTRLSPFQDELITTNPRLVLDQNFSLPLNDELYSSHHRGIRVMENGYSFLRNHKANLSIWAF